MAPMAMPLGCCPQPPCASTQSPADPLGICPRPPHGSATSPAGSYLQQGGWQLAGPHHGCCSQDHCRRGCWCRLACPWLSWGPALAQGKTLSPLVPAGCLSPAPCWASSASRGSNRVSWEEGRSLPLPRPTEDGVAPWCAAPEGEDVGVISCHHGQGVSGGGELARPCHCPVQHHGLHQRLLGPATVVAVVNSATCRGTWLSPSPRSPRADPPPAPATLPAWSYSSSTKRKKPLGFLRRMRMAFSVISTMEGSVDVLRFSSYLMSLGSKRPGGGG